VQVPTGLVDECVSAGIDVRIPDRARLEDILMKYTGIRHWLIDRGLAAPADSTLAADTWRMLLVSRMGRAGDAYLRLRDAIAAEYDRERSTGSSMSAAALVHEDRFGTGRAALTVQLPASVAGDLMTKVVAGARLDRSDVITGALALGLDNHRGADVAAGS